jgi:hypothetical protein
VTEFAAWSSLEITKLVVAGLTPVLVAFFGFWLNRRLRSLEQAQWSRQKVIERRIRAYDEMAKPVNELFCFYCYVGTWKNLAPPNVVKLKRQLDQTAHISAPLFDHEFLEKYNALLDRCFSTFGRWGDDAKLRTLPDRRREAAGDTWQDKWDACFSPRGEVSEPGDVKAAYAEFMAYLARAMGAVEVDSHLLGSSPIPGNFERRAAGIVSPTEADRTAQH